MGLCNDGDILRVTAKMSWELGQNAVQNVFHYKLSGATKTDAEVFDAIAAVLDAAYDGIKSWIGTGIAFDTIRIDNVTQDRMIEEAAWPILTAGTGVTDGGPAQTSPLVMFPTGQLKVWGRKYLPPFVEGGIGPQGGIGAGPLAAIGTWASEVASDITSLAGTVLVNGAYRYAKVDPVVTARFLAFVGYAIGAILRTQRRRTGGFGS